VNYHPVNSSVGFLRALDAPQIVSSDTPRYPDSPEVRTYKIKVDLIKAIVEDDRDIHLVVSAPGHQFRTMITELPDTGCKGAAGSLKKSQLASARLAVLRDCGSISSSEFTKLKGSATITGVGYFDAIHGQLGVSPNGIELHPVLCCRLPQSGRVIVRRGLCVRPVSECAPLTGNPVNRRPQRLQSSTNATRTSSASCFVRSRVECICRDAAKTLGGA
jgi:hypothetical protein